MDRSHAPATQDPAAVRTAGGAALDLLLSAAAREHRKPAAAPPTRPTVPEASVFRKPQNGGRVGGEPQAHPAADAHSCWCARDCPVDRCVCAGIRCLLAGTCIPIAKPSALNSATDIAWKL